MPLPLPSLDRRTFAELSAEGRSMIPLLAPTWTDHNAHDPGITLQELFAWLVEMDFYRLDRTTDESRRAFLRLIGVELRPAQVADTAVIFAADPPAAGSVVVPVGTLLTDAVGTIAFATARELSVSPAKISAVFAGDLLPSRDVLAMNVPDTKSYFPFGASPQVGDALYLGFDQVLAAAGTEISLYLWTATPAADRITRRRLIEEWESVKAGDGENCARPWWRHYSVGIRWEYLAAGGTWKALAGVVDETRALTLSGPIRFTAPADAASGSDGNFFIRGRMADGRFECPPLIDAIVPNAVEARHDVELGEEKPLSGGEEGGLGPVGPDGRCNGRAGQRFALRFKPVVPGSTKLRVVPPSLPDETWRESSTWDLTGPHDRTFVFSPEDGRLAFGDGQAGRVPVAAAEIFCRYHLGGGPSGNVSAKTLSVAELAGLRVVQPFPAMGGAAAESIADAQARALDELAATRRAVTLADFETLALATPGVPIAKARAVAEYHPSFPCFRAAGCVTVVTVPLCPDARPDPGPDFLAAVGRYLDRRRTLTTEVHVIGPTYTNVVVSARLHPAPGAEAATLRKQAIAALEAFFHPLRGGPDRTGWPVGRDVYRAEVLALLAALPGVKFVDRFGLRTDGDLEPRCGNLSVCPSDLVASGAHVIEIAERNSTP